MAQQPHHGLLLYVVAICGCLLVVAPPAHTSSVKDSYYEYATNGHTSQLAYVDLLPNANGHRQRRQVSSQSPVVTTTPSVTRSSSASSPVVKPNEPTIALTKLPTVVIEPVPLAVTDKPTLTQPRPLLGVNGTGQLHVATPAVLTTEKPTLVSDPMSSNDDKGSYDMTDILEQVDVASNETADAVEAASRNLTITTKDFQYYNSSLRVDERIVNASFQVMSNMTPHGLLSKSHRRAITVQLSFQFPFYGHMVQNITVATGGFLYTGDYVHSWLAATQYIAPLMANFDTSLSEKSLIRFQDNGTAFTVLWENASLQDRKESGEFSFAATLHQSGKVVFTYFKIPVPVESIKDETHPVKIGLSDAFIIDKLIVIARRKTIYEYHRVNFSGTELSNNTIIELTPNPTCHSLFDCESCTTKLAASFNCSWCPTLNKCSTGSDRKRQEWLEKACDKIQISEPTFCPAIGTKGNTYGQEQTFDVMTPPSIIYGSSTSGAPGAKRNGDSSGGSAAQNGTQAQSFAVVRSHAEEPTVEEVGNVSVAFSFFLPVVLVSMLAVWVLYAYRNPHTKSGQLLIQYRPSQWSWRRGEARYTAATIHM